MSLVESAQHVELIPFWEVKMISAQIAEVLALVEFTVVIIAGVVLILLAFWRRKKITGALVSREIDEDFAGTVTVTKDAKIDASSWKFFVIRNLDTGQSLTTKPGEIPPAAKYPAYFAVSEAVGVGRWLVEGDKVVVRVESDQEVALEIITRPTVSNVGASLAIVILGVYGWIVAYLAVHWAVGLAVAQHFLK